MERGHIGRYDIIEQNGRIFRPFTPNPLPPDPPLEFNGRLQLKLDEANRAIGGLNTISVLLRDSGLFIYNYVRKEALLSSKIEGSQTSLSELLRFELEGSPGILANDDLTEVSNYIKALVHSQEQISSSKLIDSDLIRSAHRILLSSGRGSEKGPGVFRERQAFIVTATGDIVFVPPIPAEVPRCMKELDDFINDKGSFLPVLVRAALAHLQFETIHPFSDGNGRVGRLLITLMLFEAGILRDPILYISLYLKQNRSDYYQLLNQVRRTGDWERWLEFFLEGVRETAEGAIQISQDLQRMFEQDRRKIEEQGERRASSGLRVHEALMSEPLLTINEASTRAKLSFPATASAIELLMSLEIVQEVTGQRRNRLFAYEQYYATLQQGTETP